MTIGSKILTALKAIGRVLAAVVFVICLQFFQSISWALALLFVILCIGSCVSHLSIWPAAACFAALVAQHLIIMFYPVERLTRRFGPTKRDRT